MLLALWQTCDQVFLHSCLIHVVLPGQCAAPGVLVSGFIDYQRLIIKVGMLCTLISIQPEHCASCILLLLPVQSRSLWPSKRHYGVLCFMATWPARDVSC